MFLSAGSKLDKYAIIAPLAVGGMAELYVARSSGIEGFEKLCVLKRILPQFARDDEFVQMFLDEARLAATLHHPNVVEVYDIGISDGLYYFTMEYIHGQDLAAITAAARGQKRGLKLEHSVAIAIGAAAGLHHAHEQHGAGGTPLGIVHRDVSPTNILVSYDGHVKVVDFGIAKAAARRTMTTAGTAKGKLSYMSPEQVRASRELDRRSDVFSLGIVLYELTTGRGLYRGDSDYLIAEQILEGHVTPPRELRASYPEQLEAIVLKALAHDPANRFATARELQLELEAFAAVSQMRLSSLSLSEFVSQLFAEQVAAWREARSGGASLVDHVSSNLVTKLAGTTNTTRQHPSWWRRTSTLVGGLGVAAAIAGWGMVLHQRTTARESTAEPPPVAPTTAPAPLPPTMPPPPPLDASPIAEARPDATVAIDAGIPAVVTPKHHRTTPPKLPADAGAFDDRLTPFEPPP